MPATISIDLADPLPENFRAALPFDLPADKELHRIHNQAFGPCQFNATSSGNARFSPIHDAHGKIIPTIYAAQSFESASCEVILRAPDAPPDPGSSTIVSPRDYDGHHHSTVRTKRSVRLVELTARGQRALGLIGNALLSGGTLYYPHTRAWAEAIHRHVPWAEGIIYTSYQYGPEFAVLLFGDRCPDILDQVVPSRAIRSPIIEDELRTLGGKIGIEYAEL